MPTEHIVKKNESLSTIARLHKVADWKSIWMDPRNSTLRQARKVPERIRPGDRLFIPEPTPRSSPPGLTVGPPEQDSTILWLHPREAHAPCFSELKVKFSLYKKKQRGVPFAPKVPAWEKWSDFLPRPRLGQLEARADTQGVIRLNLRFSPAEELGIDLIWDDTQQPPIPYFSSEWPPKPGDESLPWQSLEVYQKHILGDFESNWWDSDDDVSVGQRSAVRRIISTLKQAFPTIVTLGGHKDYKDTECPGDLLYAELGALRKEFALEAPAKR